MVKRSYALNKNNKLGHLHSARVRIVLITQQDLNEPPGPNRVLANADRRLKRHLLHSQQENDPSRHQALKRYLFQRGL
jgi:hypothetical protein